MRTAWRADGCRRALALLLALALLVPAVAIQARTVAPASDTFQRVWDRADLPVAEGRVGRTWMWGSSVSEARVEPYADAPSGQRTVQYFDKSRMEITHPDAPDDGLWYVTNGLLATELISGWMQVGDSEFERRVPSELNVAGDQGFANGPSYATFSRLLSGPGAIGWTSDLGDAAVIERIDRSGIITSDTALADMSVRLARFDDVSLHNIAAPFWEFMQSDGLIYDGGALTTGALFANPYYATGRPITEPYWANVVVAGTEKLVLIQCFERRCLTYTPDNSVGWQVEAGNVGQHYHAWRYTTPLDTGGQIMFVRQRVDADGNVTSDLNLINVDGTGERNLTSAFDAPVDHGEWSPDGNRIALVADGDIYVLDVDTGDARWIAQGNTPAWSPDGAQIAFQRTLAVFESQIFVIGADGSGERQLTSIPALDPPGGDPRVSYSRDPAWSPDGTRIAFANENSSVALARRSSIYVIDADGENQRQIASGAFYRTPTWSPDGKWVMFSRPQLAGREVWGSGLHAVELDVSGAEPITLAGYDSSNPYFATWEPQSSVIAVPLTPVLHDDALRTGTRGLHLIDVESGERTQITRSGAQPDWSPDGQYIVYTIDPLTSGIAITDREGMAQWTVSADGFAPRWRPLGSGQ